MTVMADFLLQPATPSGPGRPTVADAPGGAGGRLPGGGQDFTRILVEQRQAADIRPPVPARSPHDSARQTGQQQNVARREEPVRPAREPAAAPTRTTTGQPEPTTARQKTDASSHGENDANEERPLVDEVAGEGSVVLGLPGAVLEQNLLAQEAVDEQLSGEQTPASQPVDAVAAVASLLAWPHGNPDTPELDAEPDLAAPDQRLPAGALAGRTTLTALDTPWASTAVTGSGEAVEGTDEWVGGSVTPASLLQAVGARSERAETAVTPGLTERSLTAGEVRSEALMRNEAVQATQAARQLPGPPLNMQQPGWSKELGERVLWMSAQNLKSADIKLNPAELGRLDIRIQVGQEHTQITFGSAHAGVRDSLDAQMHRLREMLEQQGMHNVDVEVADSSQQHQQQAGDSHRSERSGAGNNEDETLAVSELEPQVQGHAGLVSYYV